MHRLRAREGQPIDVAPETAQAIRRRLITLQAELQPRMDFLAAGEVQPVVQNLVGSVQITPQLVLDVEPKTAAGQSWPVAVFDLLVNERATFEAYTREAEKTPRTVLPDAFASLYAEQLDGAVRREGPLAIIVKIRMAKSRLTGRLDVTRWATGSLTQPHIFPQEHTILTVDNPYTAAMAWVAEALAIRCSDARIASRLRATAARLRPGLPAHTTIDPGVAVRDIPPQWRAYAPAWVTACAVLRRISPIHRSGVLEGLGLAIEPWPLLETLLRRSVHAAAHRGQEAGLDLRASGHSTHLLLTPEENGATTSPLRRMHTRRSIEPDATMWLGDRLVVNFEAKYTKPTRENMRHHIFQAMTTAGAMDSPVAVLVYPEPAAPIVWRTHGFDGKPRRLVAIGLDMYGYRRGRGDTKRGIWLLDIVEREVLAFVKA